MKRAPAVEDVLAKRARAGAGAEEERILDLTAGPAYPPPSAFASSTASAAFVHPPVVEVFDDDDDEEEEYGDEYFGQV